jgi:sugar lactone lactonase YvrE
VDNITGVALDGAGNLYIGDHENSRILVVTPGGVVSVLNITGLSTSLGFPTALAFDAAGSLYIADFTNGQIVEVSSLFVTGSTSTGIGTVINTGSSGFTGSTLTGLTIDFQGNIYASGQNNSKIIKVTASGIVSTLAIPNNITPAINNSQGVAADSMGNLYIVDAGNNRILKITTLEWHPF